ncbi:MAG: protease inhibitor I42 family protein [Chloroflexi bacterium]|nr:protease inhibitor I42 family protein [Chloroflexota bacterium]
MKRNVSNLTLAVMTIAVTLLGGCSPAAEEVLLDVDDSGGSVSIAMGQTLVIELPSNPTTGYSWFIESIDEAVVRQEGEATYSPVGGEPNLVGGGGVETWRFTPVAAGACTLTLAYLRVFEDNSTQDTFTIQVTVP